MRRCPFTDCGKIISPSLFACSAHWRSLNAEEQQEIYAAYNEYTAGTIQIAALRARQQAVLDAAQARFAEPSKGTCRYCGRPILWVESEGGRMMPLDPEPCNGNVALRTERGRVIGHVRKKGDLFEPEEPGPFYVSHFATCPNREKSQ